MVALLNALVAFFDVLQLLIMARIIISWIPLSDGNILVRFLRHMTEPILAPIRQLVMRSEFLKNSVFDITPMLAIILMEIIKNSL